MDRVTKFIITCVSFLLALISVGIEYFVYNITLIRVLFLLGIVLFLVIWFLLWMLLHFGSEISKQPTIVKIGLLFLYTGILFASYPGTQSPSSEIQAFQFSVLRTLGSVAISLGLLAISEDIKCSKKYRTNIEEGGRDFDEIHKQSDQQFFSIANYAELSHKKQVRVKLVTGDELTGILKEEDPYFIKLLLGEERKVYLNKIHIALIEPIDKTKADKKTKS